MRIALCSFEIMLSTKQTDDILLGPRITELSDKRYSSALNAISKAL